MIIRSIRIDAFGKFRDRQWTDIPDGLTLVVGDNESGKTTMMEFMRSTMFPSSKRSYPASSKTDSGSMTIDTESSGTLNLKREQRKVTELSGKELPEELFSMDSDTYRSIFAMDLSDLTNDDAISSDRIKNRFLTIPGGENVPNAILEIDRLKTTLMNNDRMTEKNTIGKLTEELKRTDNEIRSIHENEDEYDSCMIEMNELSQEAERLSGIQSSANEERRRINNIHAQKENIERIRSLRSKVSELEYARSLDDTSRRTYVKLSDSIAELERKIDEIGEIETVDTELLNDVREFISTYGPYASEKENMLSRIEELKDRIAEDEETVENSKIRRELTTPEMRSKVMDTSKASLPPIPIVMFILAGAFVAAAVIYDMRISVAALLFAALGVFTLVRHMRSDNHGWMESAGYPYVPKDRLPSFVQKLEMMYDTYQRIDDDNDEIVRTMEHIDSMESMAEAMSARIEGKGEILERSSMYVDHAERMIAANDTITNAERELEATSQSLSELTAPYGGNEGFESTAECKDTLIATESELKMLSSAVESATKMSVDDAWNEIQRPVDIQDMHEELSAIDRKIGELLERSRSILSDRRLNELQSKRNSLNEALRERVKEWALLSLESGMIDMSCSDIYERMQPSVITTANKYLGMMTFGRYSIDPDPRLEEFVIRDEASQKNARQWSSGLGDQVYLSIKMAIAKEMGSERLPMILDDILVRFDRSRRKGACDALLDFAKDQQVFLFSCDHSVQDTFPEGSINLISL